MSSYDFDALEVVDSEHFKDSKSSKASKGSKGSKDSKDSKQSKSKSSPPYFKHVAQSMISQDGDQMFYASWNGNGSSRCMKKLSKKYSKGLKRGDVVTVRLNMTRGHSKVSYFVNGERVRKVMSLEQNQVYHPVIVCATNG